MLGIRERDTGLGADGALLEQLWSPWRSPCRGARACSRCSPGGTLRIEAAPASHSPAGGPGLDTLGGGSGHLRSGPLGRGHVETVDCLGHPTAGPVLRHSATSNRASRTWRSLGPVHRRLGLLVHCIREGGSQGPGACRGTADRNRRCGRLPRPLVRGCCSDRRSLVLCRWWSLGDGRPWAGEPARYMDSHAMAGGGGGAGPLRGCLWGARLASRPGAGPGRLRGGRLPANLVEEGMGSWARARPRIAPRDRCQRPRLANILLRGGV